MPINYVSFDGTNTNITYAAIGDFVDFGTATTGTNIVLPTTTMTGMTYQTLLSDSTGGYVIQLFTYALNNSPVFNLLPAEAIPTYTEEELTILRQSEDEMERIRAQREDERRQQQAEFEERQAERNQREVERRELRAAARVRAEALLHSLLSAEQLEQFEQFQTVDVLGSDGHRYTLSARSYTGNVYDNDDNRRLCCHPSIAGDIPVIDSVVSQMLALREDAEAFRRVAHNYL